MVFLTTRSKRLMWTFTPQIAKYGIDLNILNFVISGLTIWMSIPYLAIWGVNVHISRLLRVVRNTIFRKAPPSVVSGYGKRSTNLNKFVATFVKHIFLSQTDLTRTHSRLNHQIWYRHPNSEAGNDEIQNVQREFFFILW
jgi:hypothetical protein